VDNAGSAQLRARFRSRLKILAQLPLGEWHETYVKQLNGECEGLSEIRFEANNVMQRPLGFISARNEFTILFWATEKGNKFVPRSACATALDWKSKVNANRSLADAIWFALE
jgi:hypothetical protein